MKKSLLLLLLLAVASFATAQITVIADYETPATSPSWEYFANGSVTAFMSEANPDASGINTSANVGVFTEAGAGGGVEQFAGMFTDPTDNLDFTGSKGEICIDVYTTSLPAVVTLKPENPSNGAFLEITKEITQANQWQQICIDFFNEPDIQGMTAQGKIYSRLVLFFGLGDIPAADRTYYFDNLTIDSDANSVSIKDIIDSNASTSDVRPLVNAGSVDFLSKAGPITFFAPSNLAFNNVPMSTVNALLADADGLLNDLLLQHMVVGSFPEDSLENEREFYALNGQKIVIENRFGSVKVNDQRITTVDLEASNGFVHLTSGIIMPEVAYEQPKLIADFDSDSTGLAFMYFENGTVSEFQTVDNPNPSGVNTAVNQVGEFIESSDAPQPFAGITSPAPRYINLTGETKYICLDIHREITGPVLLKLEGSVTGGPDTELSLDNTVTGAWERLCYDFTGTGADGHIYGQITIIPNIGEIPATSNTTYFDNILRVEDPSLLTTGLTNILNERFTIFPNPAQDRLSFIADFDVEEVFISDMTGRVLIQQGALSNNEINIQSLQGGVYFITLVDKNNQLGTVRFVKL